MKTTIPALPVQDIKQSMEFYTTKLGFTVRHHDDRFAIVVRDEVENTFTEIRQRNTEKQREVFSS